MLIIIALFIVLLLGLYALISSLDRRGEQARVLRERLASIERASNRSPSEEINILRDELLSSVPALNRMLSHSRQIAALQAYLAQAEVKMRAGKFLLVSACLGVAIGLIVVQFTNSYLFGILGLAVGCSIPFAYVSSRRTRRLRKFEALFPEAIDLLARAVRAGHAFHTALEFMSTELAEPISGEFREVYEEQKFGLPLRDVLLNLSERVPLFDVKFFVMSVLLQRDTGGNLAEILDKLSYLIRERFKILRQVRVYTAQGRLTMIILMALPFICGLMMYTISPQLAGLLFSDPIGRILVFLGFVMLTIGYLLIRKIIRIRI